MPFLINDIFNKFIFEILNLKFKEYINNTKIIKLLN